MICGGIPLEGVDLKKSKFRLWFFKGKKGLRITYLCGTWGTKMCEWASLSNVSILLLFMRPSLRFLTNKWIWTERLPKPLTPLHSKTPESAKVTPLILSVLRFVRKRSHILGISWSSWYHSMMGLGVPTMGQWSLTTSSSSTMYFCSLWPSSTVGGPNRVDKVFLLTSL